MVYSPDTNEDIDSLWGLKVDGFACVGILEQLF